MSSHSGGPEHIRTIVVDDHDELGRLVATRIAEVIRQKTGAGQPAVLGLATGSTPIGVYRELIRMHREEGLSFAQRRDVQPRRVLPDGAGQHPLLPPVHVGEPVLAHRHRARATSTSRAATSRATRWTRTCRALRGRDRRGGRHRLPAPRHRQDRAHRLQRAGLGRWRAARGSSPRHGDAPGRRRRLLRRGERARARRSRWASRRSSRRARSRSSRPASTRRAIVRRAVEGEVDLEVAATFLQRHPNTTFYVDTRRRRRSHARRDAVAARRGATGRPRSRSRAVVWLSPPDREGDPQAHAARLRRAPPVVAGGALRLAGRGERPGVQRARREDPRQDQAAERRKIICFSPHPDDDVISMGGILRKLVENENDDHRRVHDQRQHRRLRPRRAPLRGLPATAGRRAAASAERAVTELVRRVDAVPRRASARATSTSPRCRTSSASSASRRRSAASRCWGCEESAARFLNLPFYQTGKVRKDPIGAGRRRDRARRCSRRSAPTSSSSPATSPTRTARTACARRRSIGALDEIVDAGRRPARGLALPRRVAGVAGDRGHLAGAAVAGGAAAQDPGDLQAPVAEGLGPLPGARTSASSGSASRRATRTRPRSSTGSGLAEYFAMEAYVVASK